MYVFYPAEELLRIYETPISRPVLTLTPASRQPSNKVARNHHLEKPRTTRPKTKVKMAMNNEGMNPLRELTHASFNDSIKQHNSNALKLVQTVSEFANELGGAMKTHSENVRRLVDDFRSRSAEPRGDGGSMRRAWETLLRQVEADAVAHHDLSAILQQQLSRPTVEASFLRKVQSRKVFASRESYEQVVAKSEEKLQRARADYKQAYAALLTSHNPEDTELKQAYLEAHNAYVLQLRATNAITEQYQNHCLPMMLAEIAEVYEELCTLACKCIAGVSEANGERAVEQARRYQDVAAETQQVVNAQRDLQMLARNLSATAPARKPARRLFVMPSPPDQVSVERINQVPALRDELVPIGGSRQQTIDELRRESESLTQEISRLQDALNTLIRMQRKGVESNLYTKTAELQEEVSKKRFDLGVSQLHLAAVQAQKELFGAGEAAPPEGMSGRKMSNGSTGSMKHKWLKAFKSLKTSSPTTPPEKGKPTMYHAVSTVVARSRLELQETEGGHQWQENTYRKITPCDACGQVLRGHSRQGLRCRGCKANAHADCINTVQPVNCPSLVPKRSGGIPLLRRQKSTAPPPEDVSANVAAAPEHRPASGVRPFGQPLVFTSREPSPPAPTPSENKKRNKRR